MVILKSAYLGSFCLDNCKSFQLENWDADREFQWLCPWEIESCNSTPPVGAWRNRKELWKHGNGCLQGSTCSLPWICLEAIRKNPVICSRRKRGTQMPQMYTSQKLKIAWHAAFFHLVMPFNWRFFVSFLSSPFPNPLASFSFPFLSLSF